eukprot:6312763-Amphidinium_carterae.1
MGVQLILISRRRRTASWQIIKQTVAKTKIAEIVKNALFPRVFEFCCASSGRYPSSAPFLAPWQSFVSHSSPP